MRTYGKESNLIVFMQALGLFVGLSLASLLLPSILYLGAGKALLLCVGLTAFLILLLPVFFTEKYDMFEPLSFVMLITLLGVTLRSIYIVAFDNDNIRIDLLMGRPRESLLTGGVIILIGLLALVAGYMARVPKLELKHFPLFRRERWNTTRLLSVIGVLVAIAAVCTALYVKEMGIEIIVLSDISSKHKLLLENAAYKYTSLSYYRWGASLVQPAFYLLMAWFGSSKKRWFSFTGLTVFLVGLLAAAFPFLNSSRSDVILVLISAIVIWHYTRGAVSLRKIIWAVVAAVLMIMIMTSLRKNANEVEEITPYLTGETILEIMVGNRNLLGIDKTSYIIDNIPEKLDYELGSTFVLWLTAPIPRTFWPGKPIIGIGQVIANELYGHELGGGGIPPGFIVELYWNFAVPGVLMGMFLLGYWLKFMYCGFRSHLSNNRTAALMYVAIVIPFAFTLLGNNFSGTVIGALRSSISIALALRFVGKKERSLPGKDPQGLFDGQA